MRRGRGILAALLAAVLGVALQAQAGQGQGGQGQGGQGQGGQGQPAPAPFPPVTVDGKPVDWASMREKTVLITFFSMRMADLVPCLKTYQQVYDERRGANLELVAVCIDTDRLHGLRAFLEEHELTFPVVVDARGVMRQAYQPKSIPHAYFFAEGPRYLGDLPGYPESGSPSPAAFYTNLLRRGVGLDVVIEDDPSTTPWPELPDFAVPDTDLDRKSLLGTDYLIAFVAADCERCKDQLRFFRDLHTEFVEHGVRFLVVLVSDDTDPAAFRAERQLPFPVYPDKGGRLRNDVRYRGFVPDTLLVDKQGRIRYRHTTFDDEQPPLYRMELRRMLGIENPPILKGEGPSGVRRCMVCHEREYFDWLASGHAEAMRTLQATGAAERPDCITCHVVGWGRPGGYGDPRATDRAHLLVDVQCESCHGDGGPHLGAKPEDLRITAATCTPCHDEKHSLNFKFESFVPLVNHTNDLLSATPEQQAAAARRRDEARRALLEPDGAYVGGVACAECHQDQARRWQDSAHARALQRLKGAQRQDADCVRCHTTGLDRRWADGVPAKVSDPRIAEVQCEACHGPGERHTKADSPEQLRATIIGLGERCEECVIRQICTNCHDRKNDPDFVFQKALQPMKALCKPPAK